jgi:hypothetical protein
MGFATATQARQSRRPKRVHSAPVIGSRRYGLLFHFQLLSTRGYGPGAVTFNYWPFSVGQVRDFHPAVQVRFQAHVAADVTGCAKTPKWHFGRTKKGFSDPSPPKKTRHIETGEVVFSGSPAGEEFSHSL